MSRMYPPPRRRTHAGLFGLFCWVFALSPLHADPGLWKTAVDELTKLDAENPPAPHGIAFVGSSSIRFWETLAQDFPGLPVIRRGFGGSELADSVFYYDRIVLPYHPDTVVLYAGENDIHAGVPPETVAKNFEFFRQKLRATLPDTRLIYITMKPSPARWEEREKATRANALIAAACATDPHCIFLDVYSAMLDTNGQPRPELFREDKLHMNADGYAIWIRLLNPLLRK